MPILLKQELTVDAFGPVVGIDAVVAALGALHVAASGLVLGCKERKSHQLGSFTRVGKVPGQYYYCLRNNIIVQATQ